MKWFLALAIALGAAACDRNVPLGVDPDSDAATSDAGDGGTDAGAGD